MKHELFPLKRSYFNIKSIKVGQMRLIRESKVKNYGRKNKQTMFHFQS